MILFKKAADLRKWLDFQQKKGTSIGFVPTMGALHAGHISLVNMCRKTDSVAVCSIFVNPTQFNDPADFKKYPITIEKDIEMLEAAGCTALFLPSVGEMYPSGVKPRMHYDLGYLETILEGKFRPGHFQGVCMVVHRLLDIVLPDDLYLGQKDYQQCMVITKLAELTDHKTRVNITPTLREPGGLAMSSRNMRLKEDERKKATTIFRALSMIKKNIQPGNTGPLLQKAHAMLEEAGFRVDYAAIGDANDLSPVADWDGKQKIVALVAAFLNDVRLIDNMVLN